MPYGYFHKEFKELEIKANDKIEKLSSANRLQYWNIRESVEDEMFGSLLEEYKNPK